MIDPGSDSGAPPQAQRTLAASGDLEQTMEVRRDDDSAIIEGTEESGASRPRDTWDDAPPFGAFPPSVQLSKYADLGEIGRGGSGSVRLVTDRVLRRDVAMKVLLRQWDPEDRMALRFLREAQITAHLDHPNAVPVHELGLDLEHNQVFFTMKRVDGISLLEFIVQVLEREKTPDGLRKLLQAFLKVCDAVSFAHSRGVVHRDLKPSNIMVGSHGQVYVMDWGAALVLPRFRHRYPNLESEDEAGTIIGTAAYMAPEQAWGRIDAIDERTDVYGLGAILHHVLVGRGPHHDKSPVRALEASRAGQIPSIEATSIWPEPPPKLCEIATKALAKEPVHRYATVDELRDDVEQFLLGGGWFRTLTFAPGEVIVRAGDRGDAAYIITSGRCEVYKSVGDDKFSLRELGPGDTFGEVAVLTGETRTANIAAIDAVTVKVVTLASLDHELSRNPWLSKFVRALAARFVEVDGQLSSHRGWSNGPPSDRK